MKSDGPTANKLERSEEMCVKNGAEEEGRERYQNLYKDERCNLHTFH